MPTNINYHIDTDNGITFFVYKNIITIDDITNVVLENLSDPKFSVNFDMLIDLRNCNIAIKPQELVKILDIMKIEPKLNANRKAIYITTNPNQVVLSTLYSKLILHTKITPHIVSTEEKALDFLAKPKVDLNYLRKTLSDLQNNTDPLSA